MKDLIDLVLICSHTAFTAPKLRRALNWTFEVRDSLAVPDTLPSPPADWGPGYQKLAQEVGISEDAENGYQIASAFLNPVLGGQLSGNARWEPEIGEWREQSWPEA